MVLIIRCFILFRTYSGGISSTSAIPYCTYYPVLEQWYGHYPVHSNLNENDSYLQTIRINDLP